MDDHEAEWLASDAYKESFAYKAAELQYQLDILWCALLESVPRPLRRLVIWMATR